ncbi:MAG: SIMPL domain-containing protein [Chloroflexi bacterium OHK40]
MDTRNPTLLGVLAGALLVAVLALGGLAGLTLARPGAAQAQPGVNGMRQITVIGNGEIRVAPDMASVQIGVETTAPTTREALDQNTAQAEAIIDQVKQLGVAEKDIQTSGFNIYATYSDAGRTVTGYTVSNTVNVTIRDLAQAGDLLDKVVQAGANRVYGISFGVSDPKAAQAQARDAAMADARARAERLAQSGSASIGQILVISESIGSGPVVPLPAMADRFQGAGAPVPIQAGEQVITAAVQVTYELR